VIGELKISFPCNLRVTPFQISTYELVIYIILEQHTSTRRGEERRILSKKEMIKC